MSNISFSSAYGEYTSGEFFKTPAFELKFNDIFIFSREFNSELSSVVNLTENYFLIENHNFITGEELIYEYILEGDSENIPIGIATTTISGISTDILPQVLYAVKKDSTKVQVAASKTDSLLDVPKVLDLSSYGTGTHKLSTKNPNLNTLITINNIIQDPIVSTSITSFILESMNEIDLSIKIDDPSIVAAGDLMKIDEEIFRVLSVGIGSTNSIFFERRLLGTINTSHNLFSQVSKISGNYNIVKEFIYFTKSPYGNDFDASNNLKNNSVFGGRVFLRSGIKNSDIGPYDKNYIFDDISSNFDGKTSYFTLKSNSNDITGISIDNAILTVNDVFQSPSRLTGTIIDGAYVLSENSGITTVTFTGNNLFPEYDVNISNYPRGGIIFSVGSTEGMGYQPLISAGGTAIVSIAGTIQSISIGYSGSGYRAGIQTINVGVALSNIENADVEIIGSANVLNGHITGVNILNPGTGYTSSNPPYVIFDPPLSYSDIPLIYSNTSNGSGFGTAATIDIEVGQGSNVINFTLRNLGYAYENYEVLTVPIGGQTGIPTDPSISFNEFKIFIDKVYSDNSSIRTIGKLLLFDPIENLFDGNRKIFPLKLNGTQTAIFPEVGSEINVENCILIFIDDILQIPGESYYFQGGSIVKFNQAPRKGSKSTILFYSGTQNIDTKDFEVLETVKIGDKLNIYGSKENLYDQNSRTVYDIIAADATKTNIYKNQGISDNNEIRPIKWCPQDVDLLLSGYNNFTNYYVTKDRKIYEPLIEPSSYVIKEININDTEIFVDNVKTFFDNKNESPVTNDILIITQENQVSASATAIVSIAGTIASIDFQNTGYNYFSPPEISFSYPIGLGITPVITTNLGVNGEITSINIIDGGSGYDINNPPLVLIEEPRQNIKVVENVSYQGDFGIITGIGTTSIGITNALIIDLYIPEDSYLRNSTINDVGYALTGISGIQTNYYLSITNTNIGNPIVSINTTGDTIGVGTTFIDNVYQVSSYEIKQKPVLGVGLTYVNEITVNVQDNSSLIGIAGSGYYGDYSWGKISNVTGISVTFNTYVPGITTSTIIKRYNPLKSSDYLS